MGLMNKIVAKYTISLLRAVVTYLDENEIEIQREKKRYPLCLNDLKCTVFFFFSSSLADCNVIYDRNSDL